MRKMWLLGLVFALVLVGGTAYAGEPIKLGMSTWLGYAPLYLAKEKGFFQKRGLDVEIVVIESPADRRAAFAADRIWRLRSCLGRPCPVARSSSLPSCTSRITRSKTT